MSVEKKGDVYWMQEALTLARQAGDEGEVPVGAIVVIDNNIVGQGFNQPISSCDPTAHAEIIALRDAAKNIGNYRLVNATIYVTLEPCTMCAGAIVHSRVKRLIYGAKEPKAGAIESQAELLRAPYINYRVEVEGGICEQESSELISAFFTGRRAQQREQKKKEENE
ncbi:MAG: tRNA(adenine34) deaminase [Cellvibrionaceae bacterium]|jgi:tRNA(adenine34) deaminase